MTLSGWAPLSGEPRVRVAGIVLVALTAFANLAFPFRDPLSSPLAIALDGVVIRAPATRGLAAERREGP